MSDVIVNINLNFRKYQNNNAQYFGGKLVVAEESEDATVTDSVGTFIGNVASGGTFPVDDSTVRNEDDSFITTVRATKTLLLNDVEIIVEDQNSTVLGSSIVAAAVDKTVTVTLPQGTYTVSFPSAKQDIISFRAKANFTIQSQTLSNVSSYILIINETPVAVSFPLSINKGDRIRAEITRAAAGDASIQWEPTGISDTYTETAGDYFYPHWTDFNNAQISIGAQDVWQNIFEPIENASASSTNAAATDFCMVAPCEMIIWQWDQAYWHGGYIGWNDEATLSTPANLWNRMIFAIKANNFVSWSFYELGVLKFSLGVNSKVALKIDDDGINVRYYYSLDLGATWTLAYISATASSGAYRQDLLSPYSYVSMGGGAMRNN